VTKVLEGANLAVRFLVLELGALAIAAYWGYTTGDGVLRWVLAIGAPLLVAAAWGLFVSPKAKVDVARPARFTIELTILGASAAALAATGHKTLAVAFAALAVISGSLNYGVSN
jgi:Protein of unknown function (DUF2568)